MSSHLKLFLALFALCSLPLAIPVACHRVEPYEGEQAPITYGSGLTAKPNSPTHFKAAVLDRRKTSFVTSWTAPSDAYGNAVAGYVPMWARGCTTVCCPGGYTADGGVASGVGSVATCADGGASAPYPTDAGDSCGDGGVDGGSCQCQGKASKGCIPLGVTFDQAIDAGITICRGNWTRTPVKPGQQETWSTNEGSVCPPDGGSGLVQ